VALVLHRVTQSVCLCERVSLLAQVLLPVYGSSCLVALVLHRRSAVVGRCVFRLYGLLPLLLRDYSKSLTLYRCVLGGRLCVADLGESMLCFHCCVQLCKCSQRFTTCALCTTRSPDAVCLPGLSPCHVVPAVTSVGRAGVASLPAASCCACLPPLAPTAAGCARCCASAAPS
jgi:hypothetical protein